MRQSWRFYEVSAPVPLNVVQLNAETERLQSLMAGMATQAMDEEARALTRMRETFATAFQGTR